MYKTIGTILVLFFFTIISASWADQASGESAGSGILSKLFVHGYLTQAYARTNEHQLIGINDEGTTDYRMAALQFRYAITTNDNFVIQFSHERIGDSPVMQFKNDVELDWVFYEHRFNDATSVKVGKVQIPMGIYNEIRDVGTILPFYRPIFSFYFEGAYTNETLDGFVFSHIIRFKNDWSLDLDGYYGSWDSFMSTDSLYETKSRNGLGFQLWLNTPVDGVRFGMGALRYTSNGISVGELGPECTWKHWFVSGDVSFKRFVIQSEYKHATFENGWYYTAYGLFGVRLIDKLKINFQAEISKVKFSVPYIGTAEVDMDKDYAIGINYYFRPDLVVKLENHWNKGFWFDDIPLESIFYNTPWDGQYFILSLSASF